MESSSFPVEKIQEYITKEFDNNVLPNLMEFIKIPNLSRAYDPEWATNGLLEKAANFVLDWIKKQDIKDITIDVYKEKDHSPCIFGVIEGSTPDAPTALFYGHIDKQPPFSGWREGFGPTIPIIEGDKLYGRGGADDGYASFATILIIKALQTLGLPHPRCVLLFECDEESGSAHLPFYMNKFKDQIGEPSVLFGLDSGCGNYEQLWLTTSLRGVLIATLNVKIIKEGVHSGDASGVVPDSFRIIRMLLDRLENQETGEVHRDLQVQIPATHYIEAEKVMKAIGEDFMKRYPLIEGAKTMDPNPLFCYLFRTWKPTVTVTGIDGLPSTDKAGNVLRPETTVKISIRLPPTLDPNYACKTVERILTENPPYGAKVTCTTTAGSGFAAESFDPSLEETLKSASQNFYGKEMLKIAEGGTIPFINMIKQAFPKSDFVITGVLGPQSNAHGPNEFLHIPYTKKLIMCMAQAVSQVIRIYKKK